MKKTAFYITDYYKLKVGFAILIFIVTTALLSSFESASDGLDRVGFPLVFFQRNTGRCRECGNFTWFNFYYLLLDLLCCYLMSVLLVEGYKWLYNKN